MRQHAYDFRTTALASACAAAIAGFLPIGCSSDAPENEGAIGTPQCTPAGGARPCPSGQACVNGACQAPSTGGAGGASGGTSPGGTSPGGTSGGTTIPVPDGGDDDGGLDPDAACGADPYDAEIVPVSMFVMFDRSGSMLERENDDMANPSRWDMASAALSAFFQDPTAADLAVALRFFPDDAPAVGCQGGNNGACDAVACSQPLVPLMADPVALLPKLLLDPQPTDTHEAALVAAIGVSAPVMGGMGMGAGGGGTPTFAALDGALRWATAYQMAHPRPEQQTVVVLVTDGDPNGCGNNNDAIAALAGDALAAAGVATYTIGLTGSNEADMTQIATEGGGRSFFVSDGAGATAELIMAFQEIQGSALGCQYALPTPEDGGTADPTKVNVDYVPTPGATPELVGKVGSMADCGADYAWYYDNPTMPTQILLCPVTCDVVRNNPTASLSIAIGCDSRPPVPR